jgi:hypothetical protein
MSQVLSNPSSCPHCLSHGRQTEQMEWCLDEHVLSMGFYFKDSPSSPCSSSLGTACTTQQTPVSPIPEPPTHRKENFLNEGKWTPGCPKGGSLYVLLRRLNQEKLSGRKAHPNQLMGVTFACHRLHPSKPVHRCTTSVLGNLSKCASLSFRAPPSIILPSLFLELASEDPSSVSDTTSQTLGKAHQATLFIECPQCIGVKPNAELDYCTWPVGSHFKQIGR